MFDLYNESDTAVTFHRLKKIEPKPRLCTNIKVLEFGHRFYAKVLDKAANAKRLEQRSAEAALTQSYVRCSCARLLLAAVVACAALVPRRRSFPLRPGRPEAALGGWCSGRGGLSPFSESGPMLPRLFSATESSFTRATAPSSPLRRTACSGEGGERDKSVRRKHARTSDINRENTRRRQQE